ncbi:unnamed protein product [Haemonchus placei]|uniref:SWIM-type domain-containing protein n=1 Tax=Haemonchus placei TaxID=6290 RepID=A0A3P8BQN8_HAEPC|nr:unnamed protein product [Haemonchus placei]
MQRCDSECSWVSSESITLAKNWRGWSQASPAFYFPNLVMMHTSSRSLRLLNSGSKSVPSLSDLAARVCARQLSFVELERNYRDICQSRKQVSEFPVSHSLPDKLFLSVVFWCFPATADDIRLYRCRVVSCDCSCPSKSAWCQHVVALCLFRIHQPNQVQFRGEHQVTKLLDQLKCPESEINQSHGAPDPTDGGHEQVSYTAIWALDVDGLHTSIRRLLIKYCVPAPTVHCDVQYLGTAQHPIAAEWLTVMKSLRAREPEGIWNLMAIVREMFARRDENAVSLLSILTVECLANCQILLWWYATKLVQSGSWSQQTTGKNSASSQISAQLNSAQLCDEIVVLWRCAVLNPMLSPQNRRQVSPQIEPYNKFEQYFLFQEDDDLALKAALDAVGARPLFSDDDYPLLSEAVRRQKGELAIALLTRSVDNTRFSFGLFISLGFLWHQSNAAYFLDRDPGYLKLGQRGQRPTFPIPSHSPPVLR